MSLCISLFSQVVIYWFNYLFVFSSGGIYFFRSSLCIYLAFVISVFIPLFPYVFLSFVIGFVLSRCMYVSMSLRRSVFPQLF